MIRIARASSTTFDGLGDAGRRELVLLKLIGDFPTKKNKLKPGGRGHNLHYPTVIKDQLQAMVHQLQIQWGTRRCIKHPAIDVHFYVQNAGADCDGMWTSVLDCMKKAGVIFDDSIRWFNGGVHLRPAELVKHRADQRIEIFVEFPEGAADGQTRAKAVGR